ncbi:MAG: hypothetical protein R2684_14260 [Pyrinomonadaceae bacterium]
MHTETENRDLAIKYLYGDLSEGERDAFEDAVFEDVEFAEFVSDVENDLVDSYVSGSMSPLEKSRFESNYSNSESRKRRIAVADSLYSTISQKEVEIIAIAEPGLFEQIRGWFQLPQLAGLAAVTSLALIAVYWFALRSAGDESQHAAVPKEVPEATPMATLPQPQSLQTPSVTPEKSVEPETAPPEKPVKPKKTEPSDTKNPLPTPAKPPRPKTVPKAEPRRVFAFTLLPPLRSGSIPELVVPIDASSISITLKDNFGTAYKRFHVELTDSVGNQILKSTITARAGKPVSSLKLVIPRNEVGSGAFEIAVIGETPDGSFEDVSFYNFSIKTNDEE